MSSSLSNILFGVSKSGILDFLRALFLFVDYIMKRFRKQKNKKHGAMDETRFCVCTSIFVYSNIWKKASINRWHHTADGKRICKPLFVCFLFRICEFFNGGRAFQICEPQKKKKQRNKFKLSTKRKVSLFFSLRELVVHWGTRFVCHTRERSSALIYKDVYLLLCLEFLGAGLGAADTKEKGFVCEQFHTFQILHLQQPSCACPSWFASFVTGGGGGWFNMLDNITVGERNENKKQVKFKWIKNFRNIEPNVYTILITKRVWFISSPVLIV